MTQATESTGIGTEWVPIEGSVRISVVWHLPEILGDFGLDVADVLAASDLEPNLFADPENRIGYVHFQRLLATCERLTNCDYIGLLAGQRTRLADLGLAGRVALCAGTAGEGLRDFTRHFNLHSSATTASLVTSAGYVRFVYAISAIGIVDTMQLQLGAVSIAYNILRELCGAQWRPTVVTFATRPPTNLRPLHKFFGVPLHFDSDESAVVFEQRWLDWPLAPVDPALRRHVQDEVAAHQAMIQSDFPATVRRMLRKQLINGSASMDETAAIFGMHRRTLDRHLQQHGVQFSELLECVQADVARHLLRDTHMQVQQIAESLQFSNAANFATAFKRWTGVTPSVFRRSAR